MTSTSCHSFRRCEMWPIIEMSLQLITDCYRLASHFVHVVKKERFDLFYCIQIGPFTCESKAFIDL